MSLLSYSSTSIVRSAEQDLLHSSEMVALKLDEYIVSLKQDINYLASSPVLQQYLSEQSTAASTLLAEQYRALLISKPDYSQVRYIGADGVEEARAERSRDRGVTIVATTELQDKSGRPYVTETSQLPADAIYLSEINLNREYGQISSPATPTVRAAMPVYEGDVLQGIIVINTDLSQLFASMSDMVKKNYKLRLVNDRGYYLLHEDPEQTFGFEYGRASTFEQDYGGRLTMARAAAAGVVSMRGNMYASNIVQLQGATTDLLLQTVADRDEVLQPYFRWRRTGVRIILGLGLLFLFTAFAILRRQTGELAAITTKLREFPESLSVTNLPSDRNDEIGELAQGFEEMAGIIKDNVQTLETARATAENAVQDKIEFLENVSHEIRNPLQSINGLCDLLAQNNPTPKQEHLIKSLRFNTTNLTTLVSDILDYRNVIEGNISIQNDWLPVAPFVDLMYRSNAYQAVTKKIAFEQSVDIAASRLEVYVDKVRLSQVINNLVGNAIKYCRQGDSIVLSAGITTDGIRFEISDTGPGMPAAMIQRINERYYTTASKVDFVDSFGLGLTIVTELLAHMDARLMVDTEEGRGSSFTFVLPLETRALATAQSSSKVSTDVRLPQLQVVLIEDDQQIVQLYEHIIEGLGGTTISVASTDRLPADMSQIDLVISDYRLADGTLSETKDRLDARIGEHTILYVISAAEGLHELDLGADRLLSKPIDVATLQGYIVRDIGAIWYGNPSFDAIKKDYDYQEAKYMKAIRLLRSEWSATQQILRDAVLQTDRKAYDDIVHKMITSVRRLSLSRFEEVLTTIALSTDTAAHDAEQLDGMMAHYLWCIDEALLKATWK